MRVTRVYRMALVYGALYVEAGVAAGAECMESSL